MLHAGSGYSQEDGLWQPRNKEILKLAVLGTLTPTQQLLCEPEGTGLPTSISSLPLQNLPFSVVRCIRHFRTVVNTVPKSVWFWGTHVFYSAHARSLGQGHLQLRGFPTKSAIERSFWKAQLSNLIATASLKHNLLHLTTLLKVHISFQLNWRVFLSTLLNPWRGGLQFCNVQFTSFQWTSLF